MFNKKARQDVAAFFGTEDYNRRKEFGKIFEWVESKNILGEVTEYKTPTWPEIFVEFGRMKEELRALKEEKAFGINPYDFISRGTGTLPKRK